MSKLQFKKLGPNAQIPTKQSALAAGFDMYASEAKLIPKKDRLAVKTDIAVAIPDGWYGRVASRSGLAFKFGIDVGAGVIDADYRGEIAILLFNHGEEDFQVNQGDRIGQLIITKIADFEVEEVEELSETVRGEAGFGSTGVSG